MRRRLGSGIIRGPRKLFNLGLDKLPSRRRHAEWRSGSEVAGGGRRRRRRDELPPLHPDRRAITDERRKLHRLHSYSLPGAEPGVAAITHPAHDVRRRICGLVERSGGRAPQRASDSSVEFSSDNLASELPGAGVRGEQHLGPFERAADREQRAGHSRTGPEQQRHRFSDSAGTGGIRDHRADQPLFRDTDTGRTQRRRLLRVCRGHKIRPRPRLLRCGIQPLHHHRHGQCHDHLHDRRLDTHSGQRHDLHRPDFNQRHHGHPRRGVQGRLRAVGRRYANLHFSERRDSPITERRDAAGLAGQLGGERGGLRHGPGRGG